MKRCCKNDGKLLWFYVRFGNHHEHRMMSFKSIVESAWDNSFLFREKIRSFFYGERQVTSFKHVKILGINFTVFK